MSPPASAAYKSVFELDFTLPEYRNACTSALEGRPAPSSAVGQWLYSHYKHFQAAPGQQGCWDKTPGLNLFQDFSFQGHSGMDWGQMASVPYLNLRMDLSQGFTAAMGLALAQLPKLHGLYAFQK